MRWCVKEVQRVNAELDALRERSAVEPIDRGALPTLKRDPDTGEYRPGMNRRHLTASGRSTNNVPMNSISNDDLPPHMRPERSFQGLILALQRYWADWGCVILQPYDMEVGAGTFHPATTLRALGPNSWNAAYVQPSRRPKDGRYGENPNRLQHYYQMQVILKPSPEDLQELYLQIALRHRHRPEAP